MQPADESVSDGRTFDEWELVSEGAHTCSYSSSVFSHFVCVCGHVQISFEPGSDDLRLKTCMAALVVPLGVVLLRIAGIFLWHLGATH